MNHDIAHCEGKDNDLCKSCRRYLAHIESTGLDLEYVCYIEPPKEAGPNHCPDYWSMKGGERD